MLAVSLYLLSITLVAWGYWFFIYSKTRHLANLLELRPDERSGNLIHFWGILDGDAGEYMWILLDCKKWRFTKSRIYTGDEKEARAKALQELRLKVGDLTPATFFDDIPFPVYFNSNQDITDEDYILIKTESDHLAFYYYRNSIRINSYKIKGEMLPGMRLLYLKEDQHFLMTYYKNAKKGKFLAAIIFDLRTGNLIGDSDL